MNIYPKNLLKLNKIRENLKVNPGEKFNYYTKR